MTVFRQATKSEVAAHCVRFRKTTAKGRTYLKIRFRHWVLEVLSPRALNGVAHRQYTTAKVVVGDDDLVTVDSGKYEGEQLTGTHCTVGNHTWISDIRCVSLRSIY